MAKLKLNHIYKVYDNGVKAVNDFCIDIEDKEFIVFVGPSGCGKSTTLRMIAGLEEISAGDLYIGDSLVNDMEPKDRDIAMVFQNYALYPHMTVYDNMAFGLRNQKVPEDEIRDRVLEAARILDIEDYLDRKPKAMSGGQRQRVALGRAIVRKPKVFLLDEPLSNLDAKLRAQMRTEITKLHKRLATTFIYVTHDQVEAMTMGTRIVVMKKGFVQQIDTPTNLYKAPINKFVAGFIGTPQMNFFDTTLTRKDDYVEMILAEKQVLRIPLDYISKVEHKMLDGKTPVIFGIRPEDVHVEGTNENLAIEAEVTAVEELGAETLVYGDLTGSKTNETLSGSNNIIIKTSPKEHYEVGQKIKVYIDPTRIHLFNAETEMTILPPVPSVSYIDGVISGNIIEIENQKIELPPAILERISGHTHVTVGIQNNALIPGKGLSFKVLKDEHTMGKRLLHLDGKNAKIFSVIDENIKIGETFECRLDMSKIFIYDKEELLVEPVRYEDNFEGKFIKVKEKNDDGKKIVNFYVVTEGVGIYMPIDMVTKITTVLDKNAYRHSIKLAFDIHDLVISEQGVPGKVEKIDDYGDVRIAKIKIGSSEKYVNLIVNSDFDKTEVNLSIDPVKCSIFDATNDVRVI